MNTDILKKYLSLRQALQQEKAQLEARLNEINTALAAAPSDVNVEPQRARPVQRRTKNRVSMRAAVIRVTTGRPLTKPEILQAIQKEGFRSASRKPMASLSTLLYGKNPKFKNENGRFSPLGAAAGLSPVKPAPKAAKPVPKRKMSRAGRAHLKALAKARWAKIKKAGGNTLKAA